MATQRARPDHGDKVLIIRDAQEAGVVRTTAKEYLDKAFGDVSPREARIYGGIARTLHLIHNKPDGWFHAELQLEVAGLMQPRLDRGELTEVMDVVCKVIKPRKEDDQIKRLREHRREKMLAKK